MYTRKTIGLSAVLLASVTASAFAQTTRPAAARRALATTPATLPALEPVADAKAAVDAFLDLARKGDADAALACVMQRPEAPDPKADAAKRIAALVDLFARGETVQTRDGYRIGPVALVPVIGQRPMRAGRASADPMMALLRDGKWVVLLTNARAYPLSPEERTAAVALNQHWRTIRPTLIPATAPADVPATAPARN